MDFDDVERIFDKAKTHPKKTLRIIIILIAIALSIAYGKSFISEKAKQRATPSTSAPKVSTEPAKGKSSIKIRTEGEKSPAIVSEGEVEIKYGDEK